MSARAPPGTGCRAGIARPRWRRPAPSTVHLCAGDRVQQRERRSQRPGRPGQPPSRGRRQVPSRGAAAAPPPAAARAAGWHPGRVPAPMAGLLQRELDVGAHPVRRPAPSGGRTTNTGGKHPQVRVEQRVLALQVAADDVGQAAVGTVAQHRHAAVHGGWSRNVGDRHRLGLADPAHPVLVAVRQHDHVAGARPVPRRRRPPRPSTGPRRRRGRGSPGRCRDAACAAVAGPVSES